jgi:YD repeat-containing protein
MEVTWTTPHQGRNRELVVLGGGGNDVTVHHAGVGGVPGAALELLVGRQGVQFGLDNSELGTVGGDGSGVSGGVSGQDTIVLVVGTTELDEKRLKRVLVARLDVALEWLLDALGKERDVEGAVGEFGGKSRLELLAKLAKLGILAPNALELKELNALGIILRSTYNALGRVGSTRLRKGGNTRRRMDGLGAKSGSRRHSCVLGGHLIIC